MNYCYYCRNHSLSLPLLYPCPFVFVQSSGLSYATAQQSLLNIMREAPHAQRAHPRIEHLLPLHVAFAAAKPQSELGGDVGIKGERIYHQVLLETLSLDSYSFH